MPIGASNDAFMTNLISSTDSLTDMGVVDSRFTNGYTTGNENIYLSQKTTIHRPSSLPSGNVGLNKVNMKFIIDEDLLKPNN